MDRNTSIQRLDYKLLLEMICPRPRVIAISGHAGSGKDTVAGILNNELKACRKRVLITHYADLLKYICKTFLGWNGEKDAVGRSLLQKVGTDIVRAREPNYWIDFLGDVLTFFGGYWDYVLIPDARFKNEIYRLGERGFGVLHLRVERPGFNNLLTAEQQAHPSEAELDDVIPNYTIVNDGNIVELGEKIKIFMKEYLSEWKSAAQDTMNFNQN